MNAECRILKDDENDDEGKGRAGAENEAVGCCWLLAVGCWLLKVVSYDF